ncbi:MAG: diaminopimelate epimerase [Candidatus Caenarcaniphilales bacterium]|nr:diaminopimelate epimerase [Candidatus Caenarcaniphilales bacterium]
MATFILPFEKMHGLGNDFIFIHDKYLPPNVSEADLALKLCDRHFSIGGDGLIVVKASQSGEGDFAWSYHNADGSLGEMCGNGIRCFAKYVYERGLTKLTQFGVETLAGLITPSIQPDGQIRVNMGAPILDPSQIPVALPDSPPVPVIDYPIEVTGRNFNFTPVSMGNPHAVIFLDSRQEWEEINLIELGPPIEKHPFFPKQVNVEFVYAEKPDHLLFKVWERGSGITFACGTGACASVVAAVLKKISPADQPVQVSLPGGNLLIEWDQAENLVCMTGTATSVFIGQLELEL